MPTGVRQKRVFGPPVLTGFAKAVSDADVNAIRRITTGTTKDAAKQFGVSEATILDIWHNRGRFAQVPVDRADRRPTAVKE